MNLVTPYVNSSDDRNGRYSRRFHCGCCGSKRDSGERSLVKNALDDLTDAGVDVGADWRLCGMCSHQASLSPANFILRVRATKAHKAAERDALKVAAEREAAERKVAAPDAQHQRAADLVRAFTTNLLSCPVQGGPTFTAGSIPVFVPIPFYFPTPLIGSSFHLLLKLCRLDQCYSFQMLLLCRSFLRPRALRVPIIPIALLQVHLWFSQLFHHRLIFLSVCLYVIVSSSDLLVDFREVNHQHIAENDISRGVAIFKRRRSPWMSTHFDTCCFISFRFSSSDTFFFFSAPYFITPNSSTSDGSTLNIIFLFFLFFFSYSIRQRFYVSNSQGI
jgi:hypothetical protein